MVFNQAVFIGDTLCCYVSLVKIGRTSIKVHIEAYVNRDFEDTIIVLGCNTFNCDQSYWYPGLYLGAGFSTGPVTMGIRFDILYDSEKSIYGNPYNPFVRFYF